VDRTAAGFGLTSPAPLVIYSSESTPLPRSREQHLWAPSLDAGRTRV